MQKWVVICWALLALVGADECPDGGNCGDGQTCCNDPASGYECCPFDKAECCEDHVHCCPAETICDTATSSCVNATVSIPWVERASANQPMHSKSFRMIKTYMGEEDDNICPDQSRCPAEFSCLRALTKFGCCPLTQGVSCSDGKHCCPEGHQCSEDSRSCIKKEFVTTVLCPDGKSECPDGTTCCENPEGKWGCCPMPKAVCCEDKLHCCPEGATCDIEHSKCISSSTKKEMPMWAKLPARTRAEWENQKDGEQATGETIPEVTTANTVPPTDSEKPVSSVTEAVAGDVPCNDTAACPDKTTCCKTQEGGWSCCPLPEAVCCEDFLHCCPHGKKCNLAAQTCDDDTSSEPWVTKLPTIPRQSLQSTDVPCDSTASCPDGTTCCKNKAGQWACCPLPKAVCCDDHEHCCPAGTTCDPTSSQCIKGSSSVPMQQKIPAFVTEAPTTMMTTTNSDVPCNDTAACPDKTTCCKTQEGGWSCCPLPEAVCCEDFIHCCPHGKKCNMAAMTCDDDTCSVPWVTKVPTIPRQSLQSTDVPCDSTASCPDGTTCCKNKAGQWACCPLPKAVCCDDHEHCCPAGTTCDPTSSQCIKGSGSVPMQQKIPAFVTEAPTTMMTTTNSDVPCNDTAACPDKTTCCKTQEGGWSCCPLPEAVCCEDFLHCCPHGKKCNLAAQTCDDDTSSEPWVTKLPTIPRQSLQSTAVPCDSTASCPDGTTCCKNKAGQWACCPLPKAVCCDDHEHCCPAGTTCDPTSSQCIKGSGSVPMQQKIPAFVTEAPTTMMTTTSSIAVPLTEQMKEENKGPEEGKGMTDGEEEENKEDQEDENKDVQDGVQCDPHTRCPQSTTCCFMKSSQKWGCCPLPEAVCCTDGSHCCPAHYKCNERETSCIKGEVVIPWYTKLPATTSVQAHSSSVHCDSLNQCPERATCCQLATGEWGCCPLQNAVCCPDKEHCCPEGYTCNIASNSCQKVIMLQLETVPLTPVYLPMRQSQLNILKLTDIQCDEQTSCQTGETCCKMSATTWGCCPMPNAVCCSNMKHCCPTGYTCTDAGKCTQNTRFHWYSRHMLLDKKKRTLLL